MRLISDKERANGMKFCTFCKPTKTTATHRSQYRTDFKIHLACATHLGSIEDGAKPVKNLKKTHDDGYMSEADHQTWGRLF